MFVRLATVCATPRPALPFTPVSPTRPTACMSIRHLHARVIRTFPPSAVSTPPVRFELHMDGLHERDLADDPLGQFLAWFEQAKHSERQPDAMALATATPDGAPSVRMVLLKSADERGLVFGTNFD